MAEYYKISGDILTAIADRVRAMAKRTEKMTPAEILYWLERVTPLEQGYAKAAIPMSSLAFESSAVGVLQEE